MTSFAPHPMFARAIVFALVISQSVSPVMAQNAVAVLIAVAQAASERVAPTVRVNRTVPAVEAPDLRVALGDQPTPVAISEVRVLPERLTPIGRPPTADENLIVARALEAVSASGGQAIGTLEAALRAQPASPWRASIAANLGTLLWRRGYFSRAAGLWAEAWDLAKDATDPPARSVADYAMGEWLTAAVTFGQVAQIESRLAELTGRDVRGPAASKVSDARQGLWILTNRHDLAIYSGPEALWSLLTARGAARPEVRQQLDAYRPGHQGTSLTALTALASSLGEPLAMVHRARGSTVPIPSIVHLRSDHFSTVIGRDGDTYLLRDVALGGLFQMSAAALEDEASGYVLVPLAESLSPGWRLVGDAEGDRVVGHCLPGMPDSNEPCEDCETPGSGPPDDPSNPPRQDRDACSSAGCPSAMAHPLTAALLLRDTPLFYQPPRGPAVAFSLRYNHRGDRNPQAPAYGQVGPFWSHNWISYVTDNNYLVVAPYSVTDVILRGAGVETFSSYDSPTHWRSRATLIKVANDPPRYERHLPDGTVEVFTLADRAASAPGRRIFLTAVVDPQGQTLTYSYDGQFRLVAVTDALGQVTTLTYANPAYPLHVTGVTDPFGRSASITYDASGRLETVTDVVGMTSRFYYGSSDFITSMTTPYGTSVFRREGNVNGIRFIELSDPTGGTERTEFHFSTTAVAATAPAGEVPSGFEAWNVDLDKYNSFAWDARSWALYPGDYSKALVTNWTYQASMAYGHGWSRTIPHSIRRPLENRVWYRYPNQGPTYHHVSGTGIKPSLIARVLPDGTTQLTQLTYNQRGLLTSRIDPLGRQTTYTYAANNIDLLEVLQVNGGSTDLLASFSNYTAGHRPQTVTDAAGQVTTFTYNSAGQTLTATNALNEVTTFAYDSGGQGYLTSVTGAVSGSTTTLAYDGYGRLRTVTESDGYAVTQDYDALNRPTRVTYPDGTFEETVYDRLRAGQVRDRLGRLTRLGYDGAKRLTSVVDPEQRVVQLDWCSCGSLNALVDAKGQRTTWERDVQGRVTREVRADGTTDTLYSYDSAGRLATVTDPLNQVTTYTYAADGAVTQVAYANTVTPTSGVSLTYDPVYARLATMTDGIGAWTYTYNAVGVLGALQVATIDGPYATDTVSYGYDALARQNSRQLNGTGWTQAYDALGRPTVLAHALGAFTASYVGHTGRLASLAFPNGVTSTYSYLDNTQDRRLQTIHHRTSGAAMLSKFDYAYDVVGNLLTWQQERGGQAAFQYAFTHDRADQLTSAIKRTTDPTPTVLARQAWAYDPAGNRMAAQTDDNVKASSFDALNRLQGEQPGGPLVFEGTVNEPATVTIAGKPAAVDSSNAFHGTAQTASGTTTVTIQATDASGNTAAQQYEVDVTGTATTYTYDANGNLTSDGTKTYTWNARNELVKVQQGGVDVATFTYDGWGRRATKTAGGVTRTYLYDAEDVVEERVSTGDVIRYVHGPGIDQVLARTTNGANAVYYLTDHLGSVIQEVDAAQSIILDREYDPWGVPVQGGSTSGYAFTGREWDAEIALYYYRARYYNPSVAAFLGRDPVKGVASPYAYVLGRPLTHIDPDGRFLIPALLPLIPPAVAAVETATVFTVGTIVAIFIGEELSDTFEPLFAEHNKGKRKSTKEKHEQGEERRKRDHGGERADWPHGPRRPPRNPPPGHKGPWPPRPKPPTNSVMPLPVGDRCEQ